MKILIIQPAFIGDAILATAILEKLHQCYPQAVLSILVRSGNESLFQGHPFIHEVLVWHKRRHKYRNLFRLLRYIRSQRYTWIVNLHRFASSGLLTALSGARETVGYDKNPWSRWFTRRVAHVIGEGQHEVDRNQQLIAKWTDDQPAMPRLHPSEEDYAAADIPNERYLCVAPASVWFTKQWPKDKWIQLINALPQDCSVHLLGGVRERLLCEHIASMSSHPNVVVRAGTLNLLQSAALISNAVLSFCNDSAPMHLASAMNAPVAVVFCSTVPEFGFGPLSKAHWILETPEKLHCRPCGLHGKSACPEGHFACSNISTKWILAQLSPLV